MVGMNFRLVAGVYSLALVGGLLALVGSAYAASPTGVPDSKAAGQYVLRGTPDVSLVVGAVKAAVSANGGDLERENLHLVIALATGFFGADPIAAQAARQAATEVCRELLVAGDKVTARAWELTPWSFRPDSETTVTIASDDRGSIADAVAPLWPQTSREGSTGGHDTERAITQFAAGQSPDTVLVLISNTVATIGSNVLGENAPEYQKALTSWTRVPGAHGDSAVITYTVGTPSGGVATRNLESVVIAPKLFSSVTVTGATRTERIANPKPPVIVEHKRKVNWPIFIALGVLVILALSAGMFLLARRRGAPLPKFPAKAKKGLKLTVGPRSFPLNNLKAGTVVCALCGPKYPVGTAGERYVLLPDESLPPDKLLTITLTRAGLKLTPEGEVVVTGADKGMVPLTTQEREIRLTGRAQRPGMPPTRYQSVLKLALSALE